MQVRVIQFIVNMHHGKSDLSPHPELVFSSVKRDENDCITRFLLTRFSENAQKHLACNFI